MKPILSITRNILILGLLLTLISLHSCRSDKEDRGWQNQNFTTDDEIMAQSKDSVEFILLKAMQHNTRFETFSTDMDIKVKSEDGKNAFSLGGQLRIAHGKTIWITVNKLFFELGRIRITPDTVISFSKLANSAFIYTAEGMGEDTTENSILPLAYRFVENLLMQQVDTLGMTERCRLSGSNGTRWIIEGNEQDSIAWKLCIDKKDFRISEGIISILQRNNIVQMRIRYTEDRNGFELEIGSDGKIMAQATVIYTQAKWNTQLQFPISIPKGIKVTVNSGFVRNMDASIEMAH